MTRDVPSARAFARARRDPLWRVLALASPVRGRLVLACLTAAATVACAVALAGVSGWLLATAAGQPPVLTLSIAVVAVRALGLGRGVCRYVERLAGHDAALRVLSRARGDVWEALAPLVPAALPGGGRADVLERLVGDVDELQGLYLRALTPPVVAVTVGAGAVLLSGALLPAAGLVLLVGLLVSGIVVPTLVLRLDRRSTALRGPARSRLTGATVAALTGAAELEACGAATTALDRVVAADAELRRVERAAAGSTAVVDGLQALATGMLVVAVLAVGLTGVSAGRLDGVALAVLVLVAWACGELVAPLPDAVRALVVGRSAAARLLEVLDGVPSVVEPACPQPVPGGPLSLRVRGLVVRYPGSVDCALEGVDLDLPAGRRVALVGPSGSGKSTLVEVLLRLRAPTSGSVRLGGLALEDFTEMALRQAVSGCVQPVYVFGTTLRDNLLLARPEAHEADLLAAASAAGLADWVESLPFGWDTPCGEAGALLSGGQAQRLALARALLQDPRMLLLDEPTAGLDRALADDVLTDVLAATRGRTLLLVTHRLQNLDEVDEVVVLDAGRVVQRGASASLRSVPGLFRDLWEAERAGDALLSGTLFAGSRADA